MKLYQLHLRKPPWNHYKFIRAVTLAWIDPKPYWPVQSNKRASSSSVCDTATTSSPRKSKKSKTIRKRNATLSDLSLDPYSGSLRCCLDSRLTRLTEEDEKGETSCQMQYWMDKSNYQKQLMKFDAFQVTLCLKCYKIFHDRPDLMSLKE